MLKGSVLDKPDHFLLRALATCLINQIVCSQQSFCGAQSRMAPVMENDLSKFDAEAARLEQMPAAMNNNGNLFKPLENSVYVQEVEKLRKAGKVRASD